MVMKITSYQHVDLMDFEEEYGITGLHDALTSSPEDGEEEEED